MLTNASLKSSALGDLERGVPLALFLLLSLSHRGELVHDAFQRGLLVILLLLR